MGYIWSSGGRAATAGTLPLAASRKKGNRNLIEFKAITLRNPMKNGNRFKI